MLYQIDKKSPALESERLLWGLSIVLCVAIKLIAMTGDRLDYDVYFMLQHTELPYLEYVQQGGFVKTLMTYGWVVSRVFGSSIFAYRIVPLFLSVGAFMFLAVGIRNRWTGNFFMPIFCMLGLGINNWATYVLEYPIINYSIEVFLGIVLYLIFVDLSVSELTSYGLFRRIVPFTPLVIFASYTIAIPACTGIMSLIVWRLFKDKKISLRRVDLSMWPLLIVPAIQAVLYCAIPYKWIGKNSHYTLYPYLFNRSDYTQDLTGAVSFAASNTRNWLRLVLLPVGNDSIFSAIGLREWPFYLILFSFLITVFGFLLWYRRCDERIVFTLLFVALTWFVILCGSLASKFPFGTVRYTGWLLAPIVVFIGYIFSESVDFLSHKFGLRKVQGILRIGVIGVAIVLLPVFYASTAKMKARNFEVLNFLRERAGDLVLVSFQVAPAIEFWLRDQRSNMIVMANPGALDFSLEHEQQAFERFREQLRGCSPSSVLMTGVSSRQTAETHPTWMIEVDKGFEFKNEISSSLIWAGEFESLNNL